jgi:site-specific recombinase XerD
MFSAYLSSITDRAQTTQRAARRVCHDFERWRQGRTIDLSLLDEYRAKLHRSRKAASSCNTDMSHLATALRFLIRRKLVELDGDPGEVLRPFKTMKRAPVVLLHVPSRFSNTRRETAASP